MLYIRRVAGKSMLPAFRHGQIVVGIKRRRVVVGDVVIMLHEAREKIKRVAKVADGKVYVLGDNPHLSTDSRDFGWLVDDVVRATIIWPRP